MVFDKQPSWKFLSSQGDYKTKFTTGHQTTALPTTVPWEDHGRVICLVGQLWGECMICSFPRGSHLFPRKDDSLWESADRTIGKMESHSDEKATILLCTVMKMEEQIQRKVQKITDWRKDLKSFGQQQLNYIIPQKNSLQALRKRKYLEQTQQTWSMKAIFNYWQSYTLNRMCLLNQNKAASHVDKCKRALKRQNKNSSWYLSDWQNIQTTSLQSHQINVSWPLWVNQL